MDVLVDMSLELWDDNFNVQVAPKIITEDDRYIRVAMQKKSEPSRFDYNKIKDVLLTMISYMEDEGYTIKEIEVSEKYAHTLIPVELKEEKLYLKYRPEQMVDYQIGQLVINFKEQ
jgi:hypothetical protein